MTKEAVLTIQIWKSDALELSKLAGKLQAETGKRYGRKDAIRHLLKCYSGGEKPCNSQSSKP